jgi:serine/threonine protein kinase
MTAALQRPPELPGFRFDGPIEGGDGGYAKVYKYEQQSPRRVVAVKVLRGQGFGSEQYKAMLDEATAMAVLETHPHMVPVFEAKMSNDGQPCIVMMFCGGPNLMTLVADRAAPGGRPRQLNVRRVVHLGIQIAGVVQAAHEKGIVHCDIKPANVLTDDRGSPRLTDFGIAGRLGAAGRDDRKLAMSLPWCPPEILAGQQGSVASDLFSLGATLWHLLAGRSPFDVPGQNSLEELEARIADPRPPSIGRPDVPQKLEQLLSRMMAKQPHRRPRSAAEVVAVLTSVEQQIGAPQPDEPWHTIRPVTGSHVNSAAATVKDELARTILRAPANYSLTDGLPAKTELKPREVIEELPVVVPPPDPGRARWAWIAGTVVLALAIGGLLIMRPWQQKAPQQPSNVDSLVEVGSGAGGQGDDLPPGEPEITATRVDAETLRFAWTYSARLDSDTFLWRTTNATQAQAISQPSVDVKSPPGTRVCVVVKVVRADGSYGTVAWSDEGCGS